MDTMSLKARFLKYRDETIIQKVTRYAKWTLPQLMADLQMAADGNPLVLERDYQEIGALLVNHLGAKLASILFPANRPFYRIRLSKELRKEAKAQGFPESELAAQLARLEMDSCQQLFINASYNQIVLAIKHLIVTGNVLLYRDSEQSRSVAYGMQSYGVIRDGQGRMIDCVLREFTQFDSLDAELQRAVRARYPHRFTDGPTRENNCELYTRILREQRPSGDVYVVTQEIEGIQTEGEGVYPEKLCPWQAVTWSLVAGEHYGRGLVEDFAGGFAKLSDTAQALALYGISAMKVVNLVAPGNGSDVDELQDAECGDWVQGTPGTVSAYENGDAQKIAVMRAEIEAVFQNLARAFMWSANTRDAERVTQYELQLAAQEAETTLGGTYSVLSEGMQVPLAHILLQEQEDEMLAGLITGDVTLQIMAGVSALGRSSDVQSLMAASAVLGQILPILTQASKRIDPEKVVDLVFAGHSVDTSTLFKSEEQAAEEASAEAQMAEGQTQIQDSNALLSAAQQLTQSA